jgi:EAL domain-containing protein (putative c-di-GMP-specific phosphodiesterase class I)
MIYILALLNITVEFKKDFVKVFLPYFIGLFIIILNLFTPVLFYYDADNSYHRSSGILTIYVIAAFYIIRGLYYTFKYRNLISVKVRIAIYSYVTLSLIGIVIQYFYSDILLENFMNTISLTLVYITIQNPGEMINRRSNMLNRRAFISAISLKVSRKERHICAYVTVDSVRGMDSEIDRNQITELITDIAKFLKKYSRIGYVYGYNEYTFAIALKAYDEKKAKEVLREIADRFSEPWQTSRMVMKVDACSWSMKYPEDYEDIPTLIKKIDTISEMDAYKGIDILNVEDINLSEIQRAYDTEKLVKNSLATGNSEVRFQPVFNRDKKIEYYDAVFYLKDRNGEMIRGTEFVQDDMRNSTIPETDEYVFRQACKFIRYYRDEIHIPVKAAVRFNNDIVGREDFTIWLRNLMAEEYVNSDELYIKITETAISYMKRDQQKNISNLVSCGFNFIIDNFGKGYSNINRLMGIGSDSVCIHNSLIKSAADSEQFKQLLGRIVDMFHDVHKKVCIQGIITDGDDEIARSVGIDYFQGDIYQKPLGNGELDSFILERGRI